MGGPSLAENNPVQIQNEATYQEVMREVTRAGSVINGQQTGITSRSDVLERGTMSMAGVRINANYPDSVRFLPSSREPDMMFIDIRGMASEDVRIYTEYLNRTYGAGTAIDTGPFEGYDHSIKIPMSVMRDRIIPDLDRHLDTLGSISRYPDLIRSFQTQSGHAPDYQAPGESRQPPLGTPGKQGFNNGDITPGVEARRMASAAGVSGATDAAHVAAQPGGGVQRNTETQVG